MFKNRKTNIFKVYYSSSELEISNIATNKYEKAKKQRKKNI